MSLFPKFVIEDGKLTFSKVTYHNQLVIEKGNVKGGGWYSFKNETKTYILSGDSHEFGRADLDDIKRCIDNKMVFPRMFTDRNISDDFNFMYNNGVETITIKLLSEKHPKCPACSSIIIHKVHGIPNMYCEKCKNEWESIS